MNNKEFAMSHMHLRMRLMNTAFSAQGLACDCSAAKACAETLWRASVISLLEQREIDAEINALYAQNTARLTAGLQECAA